MIKTKTEEKKRQWKRSIHPRVMELLQRTYVIGIQKRQQIGKKKKIFEDIVTKDNKPQSQDSQNLKPDKQYSFPPQQNR